MGGRRPRLAGPLAIVVASGLAMSGCVAAGLAGGPLVSAFQLLGDRTVERTVAADLGEASGATEAVLARMAFRIEHGEPDREQGVRRLSAAADGVTVHVRLARVTGKLTRLGVRVESGGLVADRDTSTQILEQIAAVLAPTPGRPGVGGEAAATDALDALQGEIRRLRSDIEDRRAVERPAAVVERGPSMRVEPGAIVTVPMSVALPTVGGPAPVVSIQAPVAPIAAVTPAASTGEAVMPAAVLDPRVGAPLRPAAALTPIQPARGVASEK